MSNFESMIKEIHQKISPREVEALWKNLQVHPEIVVTYLRNSDYRDHLMTHTFLLALLRESQDMQKSEAIQQYIQELHTCSAQEIEKSFLYLLRNDQSYPMMKYILRELQSLISSDDFEKLMKNNDIHYILYS